MLKTVAVMSKKQIQDILASFPIHKDLVITRHDSVITAEIRGKKILSAISQDGKQWHVMAVDGLITH